MTRARGIRSEQAPAYEAASDDAIIARALAIAQARVTAGPAINNPKAVREYLCLRFASEQSEVFVAIWLDTQHRVLAVDDLARGTIDGAAVYPREVVKAALRCNAAAVIFAHNHPSGIPEPSAADRTLTERLRLALGQVDIKTLDHIVTGGAQAVSFAERGWL